MTPTRHTDIRERQMDDDRELQEMLTAWRAGKWVVRVILVAGTLVVTLGAAFVTLRTAMGMAPHP